MMRNYLRIDESGRTIKRELEVFGRSKRKWGIFFPFPYLLSPDVPLSRRSPAVALELPLQQAKFEENLELEFDLLVFLINYPRVKA